jgi:hypothetical protein
MTSAQLQTMVGLLTPDTNYPMAGEVIGFATEYDDGGGKYPADTVNLIVTTHEDGDEEDTRTSHMFISPDGEKLDWYEA